MNFGNNEVIERATINDVDEMINLYRAVYGRKYPISYGTDPELLARSIQDHESHMVLVARDLNKNVIRYCQKSAVFKRCRAMVGIKQIVVKKNISTVLYIRYTSICNEKSILFENIVLKEKIGICFIATK